MKIQFVYRVFYCADFLLVFYFFYRFSVLKRDIFRVSFFLLYEAITTYLLKIGQRYNFDPEKIETSLLL